MLLNTIWFALVTVLFMGFFFLEGFDYGVGMLLPFIAKNDDQRRAVINAIGPVWDGNEVWMITAGGAIFAAFPQWYATLFSGFYLALFLMLVALILRGVGFEFRSKEENPGWRNFWDWMIFLGSFLPALLWGVAVANLVRGVPIGPDMNYRGNFLTLLNPFGLLGGAAAVAVFVFHGANYLSLKLEEPLLARARATARLWAPAAVGLTVAFVLASAAYGLFSREARALAVLFTLLAAIGLLGGWYGRTRNADALAFWATGLGVLFAVASVFAGLYPNVMPSSLDPRYSLTVVNAAASPYTLRVMTWVAAIFTPLVLLYQGWTYWVFRGRVRIGSGEGY